MEALTLLGLIGSLALFGVAMIWLVRHIERFHRAAGLCIAAAALTVSAGCVPLDLVMAHSADAKAALRIASEASDQARSATTEAGRAAAIAEGIRKLGKVAAVASGNPVPVRIAEVIAALIAAFALWKTNRESKVLHDRVSKHKRETRAAANGPPAPQAGDT